MKNNLTHLHDYLFEQLERISDDSLNENELKTEIDRTRAMTSVTNSIISNGRLILDAHKFTDERMNVEKDIPKFLGCGEDE